MCKECLKKQQHQQKTQKAANLNCCQNDLLKTTCFACTWLYLSHITTLPVQPPWSRLLALGVFKPSCTTPFTLFLCLVSVYWPLQLYFIPKALSTVPLFSAPFLQLNQPFSCIYLQHSSSLYNSSYSLWSPSDPVCLPCTSSRVGGGWDPGGWGPPWGPTCFFGLDFP